MTSPDRRGVRFFPVRHHSPAAARLVGDLIRVDRPAAVLVEGPADFDEARIAAEIPLDHLPPIAIYSSVIAPGAGRLGAYHPFCAWSPEWQALRNGLAVGARVAFVDLPWAAVAGPDAPAHRYADHELRRSTLLPQLCRRLGVDDFDGAWDLLVEIDPTLGLEDYLARCTALCDELRGDGPVGALDARREAFMAARIAEIAEAVDGDVLVVCGGFHVTGIRRHLHTGAAALAIDSADPGTDSADTDSLRGRRDPGVPTPSPSPPAAPSPDAPAVPTAQPGDGRVVALTPYSFAALDALTGYEAGMPNPGFYDRVWRARTTDDPTTEPPATTVLDAIVAHLRAHDQLVSPADLVSVHTTAAALAAVRGHTQVWRTDLLDGLTSTLITDEQELDVVHPVLAAAHEVLRGGARGRLAAGVARPPLVTDLEEALRVADLQPAPRPRTITLDLTVDLTRSRLLHRIAVLELPGFDALDVVARPERGALTERWGLREHPGFDGAVVEAAGLGPTVAEAAAGRLLERLAVVERDAGAAAAVLVSAALCGLDQVAGPLLARTTELVGADPDLAAVNAALRAALHLYRYEPVLGTAGAASYGALVATCLARVTRLLDPSGSGRAPQDAGIDAVALALETHERVGPSLGCDRTELIGVLTRLRDDAVGPRAPRGPTAPAGRATAAPALRGAALGALWLLDVAVDDELAEGPLTCADPAELGDFLHGMLRLAREPLARRPDLLTQVDRVLTGWSDTEFLDAVPALRRAFSAFTPRETDHLARALLVAPTSAGAHRPTVPPEVMAHLMALESRLGPALERYGIRR